LRGGGIVEGVGGGKQPPKRSKMGIQKKRIWPHPKEKRDHTKKHHRGDFTGRKVACGEFPQLEGSVWKGVWSRRGNRTSKRVEGKNM